MSGGEPILTFLMAFKAQSASDHWRFDCELLRRCLESVLNQRDKRFRVLVVCHDEPEGISDLTPMVQFHRVGYPRQTSVSIDTNGECKTSGPNCCTGS